MDQTCPVVHKSRRPQARLKTVTLFYIHCDPTLKRYRRMQSLKGIKSLTELLKVHTLQTKNSVHSRDLMPIKDCLDFNDLMIRPLGPKSRLHMNAQLSGQLLRCWPAL
jgi:hypothetical protein